MKNDACATELATENSILKSKVSELEALVKYYEGQFRLAKHRQLGASSEKSEYDFGQLSIFNEAELFAAAVPERSLVEVEKYLEQFLLDGRLDISNNRAERSIKPFVIGRKNFLFANTPKGARASAVILSIIETAKENGLNPYDYLTYIFERAPNLNLPVPEQLNEIMPNHFPSAARP